MSFIVTFPQFNLWFKLYLLWVYHGLPIGEFQFSHGIGDHGLQESMMGLSAMTVTREIIILLEPKDGSRVMLQGLLSHSPHKIW